MNRNYDSSKVGVPFVRVNDLRITYPSPSTAHVACHEEEAVTLADGSVRHLADLGWFEFDIAPQDMDDPTPMVHPSTGAPLGADIAPQQVMLGILAVVRQRQLAR